MQKVLEYAKAVTSAIIAGLLYFFGVLPLDASIDSITFLQWIGFLIVVLGSFTGVALVPNKKPIAPEVTEYRKGKHSA